MATRSEIRQQAVEAALEAESAGELGARQALDIAKSLRKVDEFAHARRLLEKSRASREVQEDPSLDLEFRQAISLSTYKDTHLNDEQRLLRALEVLDAGDHLASSDDPETLGQAGAIYKRLWQVRNDKQALEQSLSYYRRGHVADRASGYSRKLGYPGINAAFVLDLLAHIEARLVAGGAGDVESVTNRRDEATSIRGEIADGIEPLLADVESRPQPKDYWPLVTLAEARFGRGEFKAARRWFEAAKRIEKFPDWEFKTTARQLTELARLREFGGTGSPENFAESEAGQALAPFIGEARAGLESVYVGKVGLALSGGGFRASLYHIGVLARLAELDVLRHVEVISCVSGGSIIGAHYYLELRKLLQENRDASLGPDDYVELVQRVQAGFLKGVQSNLRIRIAAEWFTNIRMLLSKSYTRTQRLGELYEKKIYSEIEDGSKDEKSSRSKFTFKRKPKPEPRYISGLFVLPKDNEGEQRFDPREQNWSRAHKVPILILNATTLNTGHNWQFTASWMGEPPTTVNTAIDSNYRLRRMYYGEAPTAHQRIRLGTAVGASSCVPGLFEPIVLDDLYPDENDPAGNRRISVRLVDGGVHDNQGVVGLIEQDCDVMLVSDASGQMGSEDVPSRGLLGVPLRSNSILQARVRDAEYADLCARERSREVRDLMFIHLTMGLSAKPVSWKGARASTAPGPDHKGPLTDYGINRRVQRLLAANRTDLDAWNDAEAYALMLSGYRMAEHEFARTITSLPPPRPLDKTPAWAFLAVDEAQKAADDRTMFMKILATGSSRAFKVWRLNGFLKALGAVLVLALAAALGWLMWANQDVVLLDVRRVALAILATIAVALFGRFAMNIVRFRDTLTRFAASIAMGIAGFIVARLHLHLFNPLYLRLGRIDVAGPESGGD